MPIFNIEETQNTNSSREGYTVEVETLADAKLHAWQNQIFQGTALKIFDSTGDLLSVLPPTRKVWEDIH